MRQVPWHMSWFKFVTVSSHHAGKYLPNMRAINPGQPVHRNWDLKGYMWQLTINLIRSAAKILGYIRLRRLTARIYSNILII